MAADISVGYGRISVVGGLWSDVSLLLTIIYTYLKILAMEHVKIQGLSELISRDLRPSSVIFSWEISAPLTEWSCSRRVCMKHLIFPVSLWTFDCLRRVNWNDSHIFILVINYSLYTKQTFNIFKERNKNVKKSINVIDSNTILATVRLLVN